MSIRARATVVVEFDVGQEWDAATTCGSVQRQAEEAAKKLVSNGMCAGATTHPRNGERVDVTIVGTPRIEVVIARPE